MYTCNKSIRSATPIIARYSLLTLMACALLAGCKTDNETSSGESARADTYFPIEIGESTPQLQLALTSAEHQKGLMFREKLPTDHGMLFIFERPKQPGFWMKNTSLPLDIGYFDAAGKLLEVHKLFPYDETPVFSSNKKILIAIETNRGWYAENGIKPGAQLNMEALKAAIAKRGLSATQYAIED